MAARTFTSEGPERPRCSAAFLKQVGGYATDGMRLLRVVRAPTDPNGRTVLVEDCWTLEAEEIERAAAAKLRIVRWP